MRVRLKEDFTWMMYQDIQERGKEWERNVVWEKHYRAGQTGVTFRDKVDLSIDKDVVVILDGYEEEKAAEAEFKARFGESPSHSSFIISVPARIIEVIDE